MSKSPKKVSLYFISATLLSSVYFYSHGHAASNVADSVDILQDEIREPSSNLIYMHEDRVLRSIPRLGNQNLEPIDHVNVNVNRVPLQNTVNLVSSPPSVCLNITRSYRRADGSIYIKNDYIPSVPITSTFVRYDHNPASHVSTEILECTATHEGANISLGEHPGSLKLNHMERQKTVGGVLQWNNNDYLRQSLPVMEWYFGDALRGTTILPGSDHVGSVPTSYRVESDVVVVVGEKGPAILTTGEQYIVTRKITSSYIRPDGSLFSPNRNEDSTYLIQESIENQFISATNWMTHYMHANFWGVIAGEEKNRMVTVKPIITYYVDLPEGRKELGKKEGDIISYKEEMYFSR